MWSDPNRMWCGFGVSQCVGGGSCVVPAGALRRGRHAGKTTRPLDQAVAPCFLHPPPSEPSNDCVNLRTDGDLNLASCCVVDGYGLAGGGCAHGGRARLLLLPTPTLPGQVQHTLHINTQSMHTYTVHCVSMCAPFCPRLCLCLNECVCCRSPIKRVREVQVYEAHPGIRTSFDCHF